MLARRSSHPGVDAFVWLSFILDNPECWDGIVGQIFFTSSCLEVSQLAQSVVQSRMFSCNVCNKHFSSNKSLMEHNGVVHGEKSLMGWYGDADGICPVCKTNFRTRIRLLKHLCDSRRTMCRDSILENSSLYSRLTDCRVFDLDDFDRLELKNARRSGSSQPIAFCSALTVQGKRIGYVTN